MINIPDDEFAKLARKHTATALRVLAEVCDDPNASQSEKAEALSALNTALVQLKAIRSDPNAPKDILTDVEEALRRFLHS